MINKYIPPTQEEIRQVAEFQHRQKALLCSHETVHFSPHRELICGDCERPLKFLSDYQIEQFTNLWRLRTSTEVSVRLSD